MDRAARRSAFTLGLVAPPPFPAIWAGARCFEKDVGSFAVAYPHQDGKDDQAFAAAAADGRMEAERGA
jgi:hypothetical protein